MKIKIRHHNGSTPQEDGWSQMGDWLAELGDDSHTNPPGDAHAEAGGTDDPWPEAFAQADARAQAYARAEADEFRRPHSSRPLRGDLPHALVQTAPGDPTHHLEFSR